MKKVLSLCVAVATVFSIGITSVAQDIEDNVQETTVTMSVEDFAEIAEDYGCIVISEDDNYPIPYMANEYTITFTNNDPWIKYDTPLLNEKVRVNVISLSSNITSVTIKLKDRKASFWSVQETLEAGDWTSIFNATMTVSYELRVIPNSPDPLSKTNQGTVKIYWTDKEDW